MDCIKAAHWSAGKWASERYCDFSDQHFLMQRGTRTEPHHGYFSYFTKPRSRPALQFQPLLWSWKSTLSNYTGRPWDNVKMITVPCMSFPPHQSLGPEPTKTCPSHKQYLVQYFFKHSLREGKDTLNILILFTDHFSLSSLLADML